MNDQILTPWLYRRWAFDFPAELYPAVIERLRGMPARAERATRDLSTERLRRTPAVGWSIARHLFHLYDLDQLLLDRLDAYEEGVPVLPPADMQNVNTTEADIDSAERDELLARIEERRGLVIERLESYPRDFFGRSAWHERLAIQKRVVDSCVFFADHDDHHLALMRMVLREV